MMQHRAVLAAVALFLGCGSLGARQADDLAVNITCKPPSFKAKRVPLTLNGTCPLSDGVCVKVDLVRELEDLRNAELIPLSEEAGGGKPLIEGKKFVYDTFLKGPGKYLVTMTIPVEHQEKPFVEEVRKRTAKKDTWHFEFLLWGDDLVPQLGSKLQEISALVAECREMVKKFEQACQSEVGWKAQAKELNAEANKLLTRIDTHNLKAFYPAAMTTLVQTLRSITRGTNVLIFENGKFSGAKDYHAEDKKMQTFRDEDYSWENFKRYVEEALTCAGREYSLWIVKDLRRTAGQMRPEIQEALKQQAKTPGVDVWADRLAKATITDLDALEVEIRGKKAAAPPKDADKK